MTTANKRIGRIKYYEKVKDSISFHAQTRGQREVGHSGDISSQEQAKSSQQGEGLTLEIPPTLVVGLRCFGHIDGELAAEGVHAHHAGVGGSVA